MVRVKLRLSVVLKFIFDTPNIPITARFIFKIKLIWTLPLQELTACNPQALCATHNLQMLGQGGNLPMEHLEILIQNYIRRTV